VSTVIAFQTKVQQRLTEAGLQFDKIDSYGPLVSAKLAIERVVQQPKIYAFRILEAIQGSQIHDFFEASDAEDGRQYLVIRFTPGDLSQPCRRPEPIVVKAATRPVTVEAKPEPVKVEPAPIEVPVKAAPVPIKAEPEEQRPAVETIAWTLITKKGTDQLKQARCQILAVDGKQAKVKITKTGQQLQVPVSKLFNHVPRLTGSQWQ